MEIKKDEMKKYLVTVSVSYVVNANTEKEACNLIRSKVENVDGCEKLHSIEACDIT